MCLLCVVSRWSRRIVTMLPWLVIPFIITWAFSQLLPPGYRLEVTSTRLACLGVLLSSLGWYELLMPWLSSWRARRSAMMRERRLIEAQEAAKWRKEATRRCRNCSTPYKIQTPGCGRFMCTYCGHVSKRPVLEVPASLSHVGGQGLHRASHSGVHSGGQLANGAGVVSFRGSVASHDTGCWSRSSERKSCWFGEGACGGENCKAWQSFVKVFSYLGSLFSFGGNIWRKVTGAGKLTAESCRTAQKAKDDLASSQESRGEKARKKANEKRQARLEKELLEAEEQKQREDVARLVEERRRQREEKLRVEKESEKEAAAEREREIRRVRELERRRKDKVKERAGDQVEGKIEHEMHAADYVIKCGEEVNPDTSAKPADAFKNARMSAGINRDQGARSKVATDNLMRVDFPKHSGTVKRRLIPAFKMGSVFQSNGPWSNKADSLWSGGKVEAPTSPSSSRSSQKSVEVAQSSVSGWRKAPWFNAWAKGSESLKDHRIQAHAVPGERLDQNLKDGGNAFNNKAVGAKQSSSAVGSTAIQPPIAPPSTHTASIHQLFSSPTIFPPLDLAVNISGQSEQMSQAEIKASFMPEHTFFETPACVTFQSCKPITGLSIPLSPATPVLVQDSLLSPRQPTVSADDGTLSYTDVPQHFTLLGSADIPETAKTTMLGSADIPETAKTTKVHCNPVSPDSVSVSDTMTCELVTNLSPTSVSPKLNGPNCNLEKHDTMFWELPPICLENTDGISEGTQECMWTTLQLRNRKVHGLFEPSPNKDPMDQEALQLPHLSTVQSLFDSEILLPESLSLSPQKEGSLSLNGDNIACGAQVFDRKGLWSDISAFNAAVQIWDDADNNQKLPPEFVDCITQEIMRDPVITADGHSYERTAIEKWLKHHDTSPKTGEVLPPPPGGVGVDKTLRPNHILRGQIIEYKEKLAKMQPSTVSWSNTSKDGEFLSTSTLGVLSF